MDKAKSKALDRLGKVAEKTLGPGGMATLSSQPPIAVMSTGVLTLDHALGIGGWTRGEIHMAYGRFSSGKTALFLLAVADKMRRDPNALVAWIDVERSLTPDWVRAFGVDTDRMVMYYTATTEEVVDTLQDVIREGLFDYIVVDSLGAVARNIEVEGKKGEGGESGTSTFGGSSGLITRMVRVANAEMTKLFRRSTVEEDIVLPGVLFINQVRADINSSYAGALTFSGGYGLEHMLSTIVRVHASNGKDDMLMGTDTTGNKVKVGSLVTVNVEKNKNAPSPRQASYYFCYSACPEYEFGVDTLRAIVDMALTYNLIEQSGPWFKLDNEEKFQGKTALIAYLKEHPELQDSLRKTVLGLVRGELVKGIEIKDET